MSPNKRVEEHRFDSQPRGQWLSDPPEDSFLVCPDGPLGKLTDHLRQFQTPL